MSAPGTAAARSRPGKKVPSPRAQAAAPSAAPTPAPSAEPPRRITAKERQEKDVIWLSRVQLEVYRILKLFVADADIVAKFVEPEAMQIWAQAFTHESRSLERNYEELEYIGDAVLKTTFAIWVTRKFPDAKKGQYSSVNTFYMAKTFQPVLARRLKLDELVRMSRHAKTNTLVETDLFEAFVGALFTIANQRIEPSYGYAVVGVFLEWVMKGVDIDITAEPPRTLVEQFFGRLGWPKPTAREERTGDKTRVSAVIPDRSRELLAQHGIAGVPAVVGAGVAWTKKVAGQIAWAKALETLKSFGVTKEWVLNLKREKFWGQPQVAALRLTLEDQARQFGFASVEYDEHLTKETTKGDGSIVHLIGVYPDGKRELITNRVIFSQKPEAISDSVIEMMKDFIENGME